MVSPVFNVARWTVFASGIAYGFVHNAGLAAAADLKHAKEVYDKRAKLIEEAKAEYRKQNPPKEPAAGEQKFDLENPSFDVVKYIEQSVDSLQA